MNFLGIFKNYLPIIWKIYFIGVVITFFIFSFLIGGIVGFDFGVFSLAFGLAVVWPISIIKLLSSGGGLPV